MESRASSKKRKRSSSHSFTGIFTRSKSENFLHRNRSGRARFDRNRRSDKPNRSRRNPGASTDEAFDDEIARISIKDLRARRVFSPASVSDECYSNEKGNTTGEYPNDTKPQLSDTDVQGEKKESGEDENLCRDIGLTEDCCQSTPPDTDVFCKSEMERNGGNTMDRDPLPVTLISGNNDSSVGEGFFRARVSQSNHSNSKKRMEDLIPCSRFKLFKTPSSFSYRRLLPFLMDLAKDNSSAMEDHPGEKVEKSVEGRPLPPLLASISHDIAVNGGGIDPLPMEQLSNDPGAPQTVKSREMIPIAGSSNIEGPDWVPPELGIAEFPNKNPHEAALVSKVNDPKIMIPSDSPSGSVSQVQLGIPYVSSKMRPSHDGISSNCDTNLLAESSYSCREASYVDGLPQFQQEMLDKCSNLDTANDAVGSIYEANVSANSSSPPTCPEASLIQVGALEVPYHFSTDVGKDCTKLVPKFSTYVRPPEGLSFLPDSSQFEALGSSESPGIGPTKGILKKNPRGCRGLCTCLNCASFRLHAERAFEYSRNQLQDAEEIAVELMKELSCVRNLLEKSVDGVKDNAILQVGQVKGACRKASRAEELAKCRLRQMNHDLNIHCKTTCLQRPRVRFASLVDEEYIPMMETCPPKALKDEDSE